MYLHYVKEKEKDREGWVVGMFKAGTVARVTLVDGQGRPDFEDGVSDDVRASVCDFVARCKWAAPIG